MTQTGRAAADQVQGRRRFLMDTGPLRHRPYRRLWLSTIATSVGSQLALAVPAFTRYRGPAH